MGVSTVEPANQPIPDGMFPIDERPAVRRWEWDPIRPYFIAGVLTPFVHSEVTTNLDHLRAAGFAQQLATTDWRWQHGAEASVVDIHDSAGKFLDRMDRGSVAIPLSERQLRAAEHFTTLVNPMSRSSVNAGRFHTLASTVATTIDLVCQHHPELHTPETLLSFLRDPAAPAIMRSLAAGGNGFRDALIGHNPDPQAAPWRDDHSKPIFHRTHQGEIKPSHEVAGAARDHRRYNQKNPEMFGQFNWVGAHGLIRPTMRESAGCPARHLIFDAEDTVLTAAGIALTDEQMRYLRDRPQPAIRQASQHHYQVIRDAYRETMEFYADCLEQLVVTERLTPERVKYVWHNKDGRLAPTREIG